MPPLSACSWLTDVLAIPRADWRAPTPSPLASALHRAPHWVLWTDATLTSSHALDPAIAPTDLRPDAIELIDAVWHSDTHRDFHDWELLSRVERIVEREVLGQRWPLPWEERLERLLVETVDGSRRTLFKHSLLPGERLSSGRVTITTELPTVTGEPLDRVEPIVLYDLENPLHGTPKVTAGAPRFVLVRPRSRCVTAFHRRMLRNGMVPVPSFIRRDHPSLRAVMTAHKLHPNQVRPVWAAMEGVPLTTLSQIEAQRWSLKLTHRECQYGLMLEMDGTEYGPCGNAWDLASILAARSPARRRPPVRARAAKSVATRASGRARR